MSNFRVLSMRLLSVTFSRVSLNLGRPSSSLKSSVSRIVFHPVVRLEGMSSHVIAFLWLCGLPDHHTHETFHRRIVVANLCVYESVVRRERRGKGALMLLADRTTEKEYTKPASKAGRQQHRSQPPSPPWPTGPPSLPRGERQTGREGGVAWRVVWSLDDTITDYAHTPEYRQSGKLSMCQPKLWECLGYMGLARRQLMLPMSRGLDCIYTRLELSLIYQLCSDGNSPLVPIQQKLASTSAAFRHAHARPGAYMPTPRSSSFSLPPSGPVAGSFIYPQGIVLKDIVCHSQSGQLISGLPTWLRKIDASSGGEKFMGRRLRPLWPTSMSLCRQSLGRGVVKWVASPESGLMKQRNRIDASSTLFCWRLAG
ncbi:unnamed protein product [Protopolystoma xenopodis]|uniref:Uncharacterized protein n=1 Tax=Protopolystoma xenopodis TaxID=117903 RepID=A0A3S5B7X3_9PLAT|nr:unnamed protein product [Protopolystoma xenopodis]